MKRTYQKGFYEICPKVRDPRSRREKAIKILRAIARHSTVPLSSAVCLDIGCSSGMISATLAPFFKTMVGLDYDATALNAADSAIREQVHLILGDAMRLPFKSDSFEVIICAQVYEHVPDDKQLFKEIYRILKKGGIVFFSGPNWLFPIEPHYYLPFLHWLPSPLADAYLRIVGRGTHYYEQSRHFWGLRKLTKQFTVLDISKEVLLLQFSGGRKGKLLHKLPRLFWKILEPLYPNFNWILKKPL